MVIVPTGATTGNVVVTVGGTASSGVSFTITTTSACASGGNAASLLKGDYAFLEQGFGQPSLTFFAFAGRFHADGVNTISNGLLEYNSVGFGNSNGTPLSFTGCFVLNTPTNSSDPALGTMTVVNSGAGLNYTFAIAVELNGNGRLIHFDKNQNFRGSGYFEKQCPNAANATCPAFFDSNISGGYVIRFAGFTTATSTANVGATGRFTASGSGGISGAVIDISTSGGVVALNDAFSGSYNVTDATNGRAEITADVTYNSGSATGTAETFHFACYLASLSSGTATVLYCMNIETPSVTLPLLSGRFIVQNTPSGGWTNTNIAPASNASAIWSTGVTGAGSARVDIGQLTYNTATNPPTVALSEDQNHGGSHSFQQGTEDISIASNGRLQATVSGALVAVCYMLDPGRGVCVNESNNAALSFFVPQEAEPSGGFTTASFDNSFAFGTVDPMTNGVNYVDGVLTSTGSTGTLAGSENINSSASGLSSPSFAATYSIGSGPDAAIGRVTIIETSPTADTLVIYIIDANTALAISTTDTEPAVIYLKH
jgi:hypothetical protein